MPDLPRYTYTPLAHPDEVRLLEISPAPAPVHKSTLPSPLGDTHDSHVLVTVHHVRISEFSRFYALSYVWGNVAGQGERAPTAVVLEAGGGDEPKEKKKVGWIPLTPNVAYALRDLRRLRDPEGEGGEEEMQESCEKKTTTTKKKRQNAQIGIWNAERPCKRSEWHDLHDGVFWWIDQLCINQQDEEEKGRQVALMSRIYQEARGVVTYLGPESHGDEMARGMRLLDEIQIGVGMAVWARVLRAGSLDRLRNWRTRGRIRMDPLRKRLRVGADEKIGEDLCNMYYEQGWDWLVRVAYGEWTRRLWIVQEQLLNRRITAFRGRRLVDWDAISTIPTLFAIEHLPYQFRDMARKRLGAHAVSFDDVERTMYGIWWERHARAESTRRGTRHAWSPLLHNLQWFQAQLCGDARDRVYALLAISRDSKTLGLTPDYSPEATVDALSRRFSVSVLRHATRLELLSFSLAWRKQLCDGDSSLPSWCVNLDRPSSSSAPENVPMRTYTPHPIKRGETLARFCGPSDAVLVLKGRIVDVAAAQQQSIAWVHDASSDAAPLHFLSSVIHALPDDFSTGDIARLLRAIAARAPWPYAADDETVAFYFLAYLRNSLLFLERYEDTLPSTAGGFLDRCEGVLAKVKAFTATEDRAFTHERSNHEQSALDKVLELSLEDGRTIGRTGSGRFFNATDAVVEGDNFVALRGADVLFAVREVEGRYRIVGDAYVEGFMCGEAYKDLEPDDVDYDIAFM